MWGFAGPRPATVGFWQCCLTLQCSFCQCCIYFYCVVQLGFQDTAITIEHFAVCYCIPMEKISCIFLRARGGYDCGIPVSVAKSFSAIAVCQLLHAVRLYNLLSALFI